MDKTRYSIFPYTRHICMLCSKKGDTLLIRMRRPVKTEYHICHFCLIEFAALVMRNDKKKTVECPMCNILQENPYFFEKRRAYVERQDLINRPSDIQEKLYAPLTESERLIVAAGCLRDGVQGECMSQA